MKSLLVLAQHPDFAEAIRSGLDPEQYRVVGRASVAEAEPLLEHGLADVCIVDVELTSVRESWLIQQLRRKAPRCPIIVCAGAKQPEWEEEAYLQGAMHVLTKPVRPRVLATVLGQFWAAPAASPPLPPVAPPPPPEVLPRAEAGATTAATQTLAILRDFSGILTHSLDAEAMLKQFLLLLREILGINRAAIFLRHSSTTFGNAPAGAENRRLRAACALGLSPGLLQHFELSFEAGIGAHLFRTGRILRRSAPEARADLEAQKEFELLGAQVAVPVLDRETVLGVAVFDGRLTGEPLLNSELELTFHLLEQLGLAIRNICLHDQLATNHEMMANILRELSSACVVVSHDCTILHANKTARRYFGRGERRSGDFSFSDLPQVLGAKIYQVLKTGSATPPFKYEPEDSPGTVYQVNVVPFQKPPAGLPGSALLMADDLTQSEQLRRLEVEAANLRLVKTMADRLTHEIGNALVPLSTHQQLLTEKWKDAEFRTSLNGAMADGVKRVTRLINQMRFLARDGLASQDSFPIAALIEEAYLEACKHQATKTAQLKREAPAKPVSVTGERIALRYALTEVMLNALQANPTDPKVLARWRVEPGRKGSRELQIDIQDSGAGFTPEAIQNASTPFFTTRNVGLGLGLAVSRRIIESHGGKLEILPSESAQSGFVRISLPLDTPPPQA
jgi:nitrogen-specific signal transduction histidine kinase